MRSLLLILLLGALAAGGWFVSTQSGAKRTSPADAVTPNGVSGITETSASVAATIRCQGKLQPVSGLIQIVAPVGSRVASLTDKPVGATVAKDEVLLTLQSRELRQQDLKLARARLSDALNEADYEKQQAEYKLSSARLAVDEAKATDEKIETERKKLDLLRTQLQTGQSLLNRLTKIRDNPNTRDLLNQTDFEKQQLMVEQLELQIEQGELEIELAKKSAARAQTAARNNVETIEDSLENADKAIPLSSLNAAVEMAQLAVDMTEIKSPLNEATILDIIVREGDSVTNKPVMVLGDTSQMHCVAEVSDQFLHLIDIGAHPNLRARISSPALKAPLTGTVVSKGVMIGAASLVDPNPFGNVDRRTSNVTIQLDDASEAARLVNLQVDVEIETKPGTLK